MPTWKEQLQQIQKLRLVRRESDEQLYASKVNLNKIENTLRKIRLQETSVPTDLSEINALRTMISSQEASLQELTKQINDVGTISTQVKENAGLISFIEKKYRPCLRK